MTTTANDMIGSEKQIKWAASIKANLERWIEKAKSELPEDKHSAIEGMFAKVLNQKSAGWWIDNIKLAEINSELSHKFSAGSAFAIKPGAWQAELRGVVAINNAL